MSLIEWLDENWEEGNMLPPPMDALQAIDFLRQYLLGKDWYVVNSVSVGQVNTEIVHKILLRYSKKYKKEFKKHVKETRAR